jgi:aspartate aminotransferase-like enzyme
VLSNGEFGQRLVDHARRFGLDFDVLESDWGSPVDLDRLADLFAAGTRLDWVWAVHCETSTGLLADLPRLGELCRTYRTRLCVDAISSLGTLDLDLSGAWLATGASGKALGSYPGISMVFYQEPPPAGGLPRYLDLGELVAAQGVAYTQSSNLVAALDAALTAADWPDRYRQLAAGSSWLAARLRRLGFDVVAAARHAAPGICTVALPAPLDAQVVGERMAADGYLLAYQSGYLRHRNWLQISLMGRWTWPVLRALPAALSRAAQLGNHDEPA